jgi:nucleotidyltransferase substrate binding protein (TIGR01987 family)
MEDRIDIFVKQLASAVEDFRSCLDMDLSLYGEKEADLLKNGQIQKFEFSIEILWKTLRIFLYEIHGFDIQSPKGVIKKFFELGYINYQTSDNLLRAIEIRNTLSHVYMKEVFQTLYREILPYSEVFIKVLEVLTTEGKNL